MSLRETLIKHLELEEEELDPKVVHMTLLTV